MDAGVTRTFHADHGGLRRAVTVEQRHAPDLPRAGAQVCGERFGGRTDQARRDAQAAGLLLLQQPANDRRIGEQQLRLIGVQRGDDLVGRHDHGEARRSGLSGLDLLEDAVGEMERRRGTDAEVAAVRPHAHRRQPAPHVGDDDLPAGAVIGDDRALAGGTARGEQPVLSEQGLARLLAGQMSQGGGETQSGIGDDPIELAHQGGLAEHRQVFEPDVGRHRRADGGAVVGRIRHGMRHERAQSIALVFEQLVPGPAVALDHGAGERLDSSWVDRRRSRCGRGALRGCFGGGHESPGRLFFRPAGLVMLQMKVTTVASN